MTGQQAQPGTQTYPEALTGGEAPGLAAFTALEEGVPQGLLGSQAPHRIHMQQPRDLGGCQGVSSSSRASPLAPWPQLTRSLTVLERSSHSGELNW